MKERTVLGFKPALEAGYEPRNYSWSPEIVPVGVYEATLDFMIWSNKHIAVDCYLSTDDNKHIRLTAYRNKADDYMAGAVAVACLPFGTRLMVTVALNGNGNPKWTDAAVISDGEPSAG
ncbi:hypothetical protein DIU31_006060 [Mucilaginibacter rubeus]|uniref:Uncharacterized protein n=1 Tax=Mucilaginibacter rubeus TaxID=2027860 RepID=A0AAE6JDK2_9SPHI|nr:MULTISPECIES: hypothetical protein [Mucilaginibacter]QEM03105.1 hypothetical protein DIU31_006060 [Mucilaginibacter rubeus]QEM15723.1 hypothetical protein DIU38_006130 [Mucilaginibacter gossypii]QTE41537.1 hypothetical protein J3L19_21650 [Mucilaginibacter rubeus]QTE48143.1 hypothetical protein J3L21_21650 [Mucilaginibacter rubeus]QTE59534.1 hypothetical protein J3L23_13295 [Mucilaginibacter rubeus]